MFGAIIGDIVGSIYEDVNVKTKDFPLFDVRCTFTDDTVLTIATARWLLEQGDCYKHYYELTRKYPDRGYGTNYMKWFFQIKFHNNPQPYNSCGNGSAMRISPVGWAFNTIDDTLRAAKISAECTHNHPEGIKGAQAIALCVFLARQGSAVKEIKQKIEDEFGYDLTMNINELRMHYSWDGIDGEGNGGLCQHSVPQAIMCALQASDFEDAIRNAVSIGGDSDTISCITGGIAEALFGIPGTILSTAMSYLPEDLIQIASRFEKIYGKKVLSNY
jgi:ADP-ribosylglycohydrolase